ncbi:retrovirus-related pol polyprotein from transposon TNT 1-94 [Tanacetum coccineum]
MTRSNQHYVLIQKNTCYALVSQVNQKSIEISDLNVSLLEKDLVITTLKNELRKLKGKDLANNVVTKHLVAPEMLKVDVEPIAPKLLNNRTAHSYYLKHTQEQATILRERPTGRTITIVGNACPLARITITAEVPLRKPTALESTLKFRNDHVAKISGYGDYHIGNIKISRVYYVEGLGHNLFFVGQLYMMASSPICLLSKASKIKSWLWHRHLSHLNFGAINHLAKHGLVRGLPKLKFKKDHLCSECAMGKSKKKPHKPKSEDTNQEKLYLLHMDLYGLMRVASVNGKKYILSVVSHIVDLLWSSWDDVDRLGDVGGVYRSGGVWLLRCWGMESGWNGAEKSNVKRTYKWYQMPIEGICVRRITRHRQTPTQHLYKMYNLLNDEFSQTPQCPVEALNHEDASRFTGQYRMESSAPTKRISMERMAQEYLDNSFPKKYEKDFMEWMMQKRYGKPSELGLVLMVLSIKLDGCNHKFLRSFPPAWSNLAMTMRTNPEIDTLSIDDLYNNLRVFEQEIQGASKTSSSAQNRTGNLLHEDLEQIDDVDIEEMDINWQIAMIAIRMKKFYKKTGRRVRVDGKTPVAKGTHDGKKKRDSFYQHQEAGKQEKNQMGLLTMDDGIVNWGEHTEVEETNHALMAISSSNELGDQEAQILAYSQAVKKLEAQLKYISFMERFFQDLWRLIDSVSMSSNVLVGLGFEIQSKMRVLSVPHPLTRDYTPKPQKEIDDSFLSHLNEQQKKRRAQVQFEAQHYTDEDWDLIRAKIEANAELSKSMLGSDLQGEDFAKKMVDLVNQRKKYFAEERARAKRNKPMTQSQLKTYMMNYLKNQGTWKLSQLKNLSFEEVKEEFDKLVKQVESFAPINFEATKASLKRFGEELQTKTSKRLKSDEAKDDDYEDSDEVSEQDDSVSGTKIPINPVPVAMKSPSIATYKIIKQGEKGVYQIVREDGTDIVYINFGAMLKDISRDDLTELYRIVMNRYGMDGPEDELEKVFWKYLKNMFEEPLSTNPIWSALAEICKAMLDKKLQGGKPDEDCYKILKIMEKQAGIRK